MNKKTIDILTKYHSSIKALAESYYNATKNRVLITATGFIEMLQYFTDILSKRQSQVESQIQKYEKGVQCLDGATELIQKLSVQIDSMKPGLEVKNKETEKTMNVFFAKRS